MKNLTARPGLPHRGSESFPEHFLHPRPHGRVRAASKKPLRILKFGGTSVGNASCMERVMEIVRSSSLDSDLVVVLSAMSGVTNELMTAASRAEAGDYAAAAAIFAGLRRRHIAALNDLVRSAEQRSRIERKLEELLEIGDGLCRGTTLLRELTPRTRDVISSLGERLSVRLVATALAERGLASQAIESAELVLTNDNHGDAEPCMELTRQRCEMRLRPLLQQGITPVVTGFIGATADGVLTTLGRGGSDYSATIVAAALDASEVVIWTDVDGLQTADPRLVPEARTIPEISYREAADLAHFGAKVLHPKTLRPVMSSGIPLRIRNTFAPGHVGTKITPEGPKSDGAVKALSAVSDVALINLSGPAFVGLPDVFGRALRAAAAARADVLMISYASSQNNLSLVIRSALPGRILEALRREFSHDLARQAVEPTVIDGTLALITVVGGSVRSIPGIVSGAFGALAAENVNVIAMAQSPSDRIISLLVEKNDAKLALSTLHREFKLADWGNGTFRRAECGSPTALA